MKVFSTKAIIVCALAGTLILQSGCGRSYSGGYSKGYGTATNAGFAMDSVASEGSFISGGNTYVSGEYTDYSYTFNAEGNTKKSRREMLDYYESVQSLAEENGGYIDNVYNNYDNYVIDYTSYYISSQERSYKYWGQLRFTIEVPNENIGVILESLENFCNENNFTVTTYNQSIVNYIGYDIVDNYDDLDYWERQGKITQAELDKRIKYAEVYVNINYYSQRSKLAKMWIGFVDGWLSFWDDLGEVITVFLVFGFAIFLFALEIIFLHRLYKKMSYKHRVKRPEYYAPKEVIVVKETNDSGK